jgi:hypothetical protein
MRMVPLEFLNPSIVVNEVFRGVGKTWRQVHIDIPVLDRNVRGPNSTLVQVIDDDDHHRLI